MFHFFCVGQVRWPTTAMRQICLLIDTVLLHFLLLNSSDRCSYIASYCRYSTKQIALLPLTSLWNLNVFHFICLFLCLQGTRIKNAEKRSHHLALLVWAAVEVVSRFRWIGKSETGMRIRHTMPLYITFQSVHGLYTVSLHSRKYCVIHWVSTWNKVYIKVYKYQLYFLDKCFAFACKKINLYQRFNWNCFTIFVGLMIIYSQ